MNDREKLIELLTREIRAGAYFNRPRIEGLADYLIANGVIVPPVKVGQKVWEMNFKNIIIEQEILGMDVEQYVEDYGMTNDIMMKVGYRCNTGGFTLHYFHLDDIGTKLFLTREEAETALAKRMKEVK